MTSPLKAYIATAKRFYTSEWLAWAWKRHGGEVVADLRDADVVMVSLQDVQDIPFLRATARQIEALGRRPLLATGGLQAWTGNGAALAYADVVIVGEGTEWIRTACESGLDAACSLPCVTTRDDPWRPVTPSRELDIESAPVVQVNKSVWYALAGRGCHNKCHFCMTSWATPYVTGDTGHLRRVRRRVEEIPKASLTYITNDSENIDLHTRVAQSMTVADYLRIAQYVRAPLIRLGVEGLSEERRRWFGKPITDDALRAAYDIAGRNGQELHVFMIVGHHGDAAALRDYAATVLPFTNEKRPAIWHKWTMFQPVPFTPLWTYDCRQLVEWEHELAFRTCSGRCRRYRDYRASSVAVAVHRAAMSRVLWEHAELVRRPRQGESGSDYMDDLARRGLDYAVTPTERDRLPGSQVLMESAGARDVVAGHMGQPALRRESNS